MLTRSVVRSNLSGTDRPPQILSGMEIKIPASGLTEKREFIHERVYYIILRDISQEVKKQ